MAEVKITFDMLFAFKTFLDDLEMYLKDQIAPDAVIPYLTLTRREVGRILRECENEIELLQKKNESTS